MRAKLLIGILSLAALAMNCPAQQGGQIVQGMNLVNPHRGSVEYQDELISQLRENNIHVVRCWISPNPKDIDFAKRLYAAGIKIDVLLKPEYPPGTPVRPPPPTHMNNMWSLPRLADASPELSKKAFESELGQLDAKGIQVVGFELGNEINAAGFNGDFPAPGQGKTFNLQDLSSDPEAEQAAKGLLQYLKILAALKEVRDRSRLNSHAPIVLAGLAPINGPAIHPNNRADAVSINATIQFLQQHGLDDLVDIYGVHIYPKAASPAAMKSDIDANNVEKCGKPKPCWVTEWGFDNDDSSCPVNDDARAALVQSVMDDFRALVKQGKLTGELYFSWDTDPNSKEPWKRTIYRCGQLTKSGKEAMEPLTQ